MTLILAGLYAGIILASIAMIRGMSLGWWLVATLIFLPRWLYLAPLVPLAIGAIRSRRSVVYAMVLADLLLVVGPLMGFSVPAGRWFATPPAGPIVRVMTFNRGGATIDTDRLIRYLERHRIDVVCFQETVKNSGLEESLIEGGWHFDQEHRVASRLPIVKDFGRATDETLSDFRYPMTLDRVRLKHPDGFEFVVGSVHLPTVRRAFDRLLAGDVDGFRLNLTWWDEEAIRLRELMADSGATPLIVAGDFNMPADYHGMASLRASYPSAFEQAGWGCGYTRPTALPWVRIDHVVASPDWSFTRCWVGPDLGSDHLPLIAEAVLIDHKTTD
jgi:vancomycin resistance protein VanJ